jgi:hypothetical protein
LEHTASGWLGKSQNPLHRRYWIDGFLPDAITNTKEGLIVTGVVWMMSESRDSEWRFFASVPQKLVHRRTRPFQIEDVWIDEDKRTLEFSLVVLGGSEKD